MDIQLIQNLQFYMTDPVPAAVRNQPGVADHGHSSDGRSCERAWRRSPPSVVRDNGQEDGQSLSIGGARHGKALSKKSIKVLTHG